MAFNRRVRVTLRCLQEDLSLPVPSLDVELSELGHPMLEEAKRIAPTSPEGQKRILSIDHPLIYRLRRSDQRAATWVDEESEIFWLLAVETREEGSDDDAFAYFRRLHTAGHLLPTDDDRLRDHLEAATRLNRAIAEDLKQAVGSARAHRQTEVHVDLADLVPARLYVLNTNGLEEIWFAVSLRDNEGEGVNERLRDAIFALLQQLVQPDAWEWRPDWPEGELDWFEVAQLSLKSTAGR